jgi:hypothetical protein
MSGWPDPDNPGVPLNPEKDGIHWLFSEKTTKYHPVNWVAEINAWEVGSAWTPKMMSETSLYYLGRVLTPAEAATLRAENARLRVALEDLLDDTWVGDFGEWFEDRLKQARAALDPDGQKERRAKALAELAEMDADLLDQPTPGVKP